MPKHTGTLTVGMLIDVLSRYGRDLPIVITMNGEYEMNITENDVLGANGNLFIGDVDVFGEITPDPM
jgi:hypothetical protein